MGTQKQETGKGETKMSDVEEIIERTKEFQIVAVSKNLIEVELFGKRVHIDKGYLSWAISEVEGWQKGRTNFTACLMGLIAKADSGNKKKISKGFPEEVLAYFMWYYKESNQKYTSGEDEDFFRGTQEWLRIKEEGEN